MNTSVRRARPDDAPSLEVVRRQAREAGFTDEYSRSDAAAVIASPDRPVRDWIDADASRVWVVESPVTVLAFGVYDARTERIAALYTAPDYQRNGHGTALLERMEREAAATGTTRLRARVPRNAIEFFNRRGFVQEGTTEHRGLSMVEMHKQLS